MNVYDEQHDGQRAFWDDEVVVTTARSARRDPFVTRLATMVVVGLVVSLLAWGVRSASGDDSAPAVPAQQPEGPTHLVPVTTASVTSAPATTAPATITSVAVDAAAAPHAVTLAAQPAVGGAVEQVQTAPARKVCDNPYTVAKGDGWIVIAKRAGVTTKQLLKANGATAKTKLYPGRTVCLPKGASAATAAPAKSKPATPAPPVAAPPTTAVQTRSYSAAEVEAIIRQVWPDELEDKAITIATRESRLKPTARNWCCSGLFQIYFSVHATWLAGVGVSSADQLLDPTVNANAAYALYQRAGGWRPWGG